MAYLRNIEQVRSVQWGSDHLWDILFLDGNPPSPFDSWFPAKTIRENKFTQQSYNGNIGNTTFKLPESTTDFSLDVTFAEDVGLELLQWFADWVNNDIFLGGAGQVNYLESIARNVAIVKMNARKEPIRITQYLVYPEGEMYFEGASDGK
jgi:hypothetical protein